MLCPPEATPGQLVVDLAPSWPQADPSGHTRLPLPVEKAAASVTASLTRAAHESGLLGGLFLIEVTWFMGVVDSVGVGLREDPRNRLAAMCGCVGTTASRFRMRCTLHRWRAAPWHQPPGPPGPRLRSAPVSAAPTRASAGRGAYGHVERIQQSVSQRRLHAHGPAAAASPWFVLEAIPRRSGTDAAPALYPLIAISDRQSPLQEVVAQRRRGRPVCTGDPTPIAAPRNPRSLTMGRPRSAAAGPLAYDGRRI